MIQSKKALNALLENDSFIENPWHYLEKELNHWEKEGVIAEFWWRDDDAYEDTAQLEKLIHIADNVAVNLAVIPNKLQSSLIDKLQKHKNFSISVHGFNHDNHIPKPQKSSEFGDNRDLKIMKEELEKGSTLLKKSFPSDFIPMFVPPWNRIGQNAVALLQEVGLEILSTFTPRAPNTGPFILNTHIDPVFWRDNARFIGEATALGQAIIHLQSKREGWSDVDPIEPTGFLTHHLIHDPEIWEFTQKFRDFILSHNQTVWIDLKDYTANFNLTD